MIKTEAYNKVKTELICLGDSLTFGYGVRNDKRWTSLVSAESGFRLVNMGLCGDTCAGMLLRLRTQVLGSSHSGIACPRVMLMGGINDIFYGGGTESARVNMGTMIQHLLAVGVKPIIGISMRFKLERFPTQWATAVELDRAAALIEEYHQWLESYCNAFGIRAIADFRPPFDNSQEELFCDGLHPNEMGHRLMADTLLEVLGK